MSDESNSTEDQESNVENFENENTNDSQNYENSEPEEKLIPQSQVNKIVGKTRQEVADKVRREYEEKYAKESSQQHSSAPKTLGGQKQLSDEEINEMIDRRVEERSQKSMAHRLVEDFSNKLKAGGEKYDDFDQVVSELNLPELPAIVRWTNSLDNTADVLYDLGKNPEKFASVLTLANAAPAQATALLQRLSDSVKKNQEAAKNERSANEPLDHLKPSATGLDNGQMTVSDLRKADWLRG